MLLDPRVSFKRLEAVPAGLPGRCRGHPNFATPQGRHPTRVSGRTGKALVLRVNTIIVYYSAP